MYIFLDQTLAKNKICLFMTSAQSSYLYRLVPCWSDVNFNFDSSWNSY